MAPTGEYTVRTAGFHPVEVIISPVDYRGLSEENLRRAEAMIRRHEIVDAPGLRHNIVSKDFGRPIGQSDCVVVRSGDRVVWVKLKGRDVWGKFIWNQRTEPTAHLTLILKKFEEGRGRRKCVTWRLIRAFAGEHAPAFPGDRNEARGSREFWATHALRRGAIPVNKDCRPVRDCPW